jgi:hypothetical protein
MCSSRSSGWRWQDIMNNIGKLRDAAYTALLLSPHPSTCLLKRSWLIDVLMCPRCGGPMMVISTNQNEATACRILEHLWLAARAPPRRSCADAPLE